MNTSVASVRALTGPGGTTTRSNALTATELQTVMMAAYTSYAEIGKPVGPSKVSRLVHRFGHALKQNQLTFSEFMKLSPNRRMQAIRDPDLAIVIAYLDPTGETAVRIAEHRRGCRCRYHKDKPGGCS